jgi:1-acyl-sn-glycerol-3-phosphate acyltransferase
MVWALRRGERVLLFPEGTTTDGTGVRRFRSRLIEAAVLADTPVQPVALRFVEGEGTDRAVPFVGEDAFLPHLVRLAGRNAVRAEVTFLDPIPARSAPREALAARCEAGVRAVVEAWESAAPRVTAPPPAQRGSAPA